MTAIPKPKHLGWCPRCKARMTYERIRLPGARASFKSCCECHGRILRRRPLKQGGKRPRPKSERKELVAQLDAVFSRIVRSVGQCERCGKLDPKALQCAHGIGRSYHWVRWDRRNAWCLCAGCHRYMTGRPEEWREWRLGPGGQTLDTLDELWAVAQKGLLGIKPLISGAESPPLWWLREKLEALNEQEKGVA